MSGSYNPWLIGLGVVVAVAVYEALRAIARLLAGRLHPTRRRSRHHEALEQAQARLQHFATHDALTDLPNRLLLADRVEQAIALADRNSTRFALLLIDLDHFKAVNDSLGHAAGDELLAEVARRLTATVRKSDTLARFGGDEFVLIVNDVAAADEIEGLIGKVCECLTRPIELSDLEVHVSLSVGVSIYPNDGADRETLLKHADVAMYQAKRAGRNGYQFYAPAMNAFTRERLGVEDDLRRGGPPGEAVAAARLAAAGSDQPVGGAAATEVAAGDGARRAGGERSRPCGPRARAHRDRGHAGRGSFRAHAAPGERPGSEHRGRRFRHRLLEPELPAAAAAAAAQDRSQLRARYSQLPRDRGDRAGDRLTRGEPGSAGHRRGRGDTRTARGAAAPRLREVPGFVLRRTSRRVAAAGEHSRV